MPRLMDGVAALDEALEPAKEIYKVYEKRVAERIGRLKEIIEKGEFTFDSDRTIAPDIPPTAPTTRCATSSWIANRSPST